uniref:Uncharacterized protein n=1 Tax=Leersia perrieri TaxID=77586 RepID=A0A0D9XNV7_9ORYZ
MTSSSLSDHLPLVPSPELAGLQPPVVETQHVLLVQINRFACGGIVVASSAHHQAADGLSMGTFYKAWADGVRRKNSAPPMIDLFPVPYGRRVLSPRRPPRCQFEHRGKEFTPLINGATVAISQGHGIRVVDPSEIANLLLHFPTKFVAELKRRVQGKYTTFETVTAHVWKSITAVRGLDASTRTSVNVAVNGRGRLGGTAALPKEGFFGNLVLTASSGTTARELTTGALADVAALVRKGIRAIHRRYFQSFVDFGALHDDDDEPLEPANMDAPGMLSLNVDSDDWLHLELHRLDLGRGGRLVGILPANILQEGVVVVMPSLRKGGGVDVFVALWEKYAKEFTDIAYSLRPKL